ncbi:MAG: hypothetical protein BWK79_12110 [Beggiatoa sp. IS2]|nr:MAG: hypothetical protein BWK79_12110 [Beggiatoa sp. IS2]
MSKEQIETHAYHKGRKTGQQCGLNPNLEPLNPYHSNSIDFLEWEDGFFDGKNSQQADSPNFLQESQIDHIGCSCSSNKIKERFFSMKNS